MRVLSEELFQHIRTLYLPARVSVTYKYPKPIATAIAVPTMAFLYRVAGNLAIGAVAVKEEA